MIYDYKGSFQYSEPIVKNWNSNAIGVYYCGVALQNGGLQPFYIGKGAGEGGMRSRLIDHLLNDVWPDVTHFSYRACDTSSEAEALEAQEIKRCQPKYNKIGK